MSYNEGPENAEFVDYEDESNATGRPLTAGVYLTGLSFLDPNDEEGFDSYLNRLLPIQISDIEPIKLGEDAYNSYYLQADTDGPEINASDHGRFDSNETHEFIRKFRLGLEKDNTLSYGVCLGTLMLGKPQQKLDLYCDPARQLEDAPFYIIMNILDKSLWLLLNIDAEDEDGNPIFEDLEATQWPILLQVLGRIGLREISTLKIAGVHWVGNKPSEPGFKILEVDTTDVAVAYAPKVDVRAALSKCAGHNAVPVIQPSHQEFPTRGLWTSTTVKNGVLVRPRDRKTKASQSQDPSAPSASSALPADTSGSPSGLNLDDQGARTSSRNGS